jgi:hypothetical protein
MHSRMSWLQLTETWVVPIAFTARSYCLLTGGVPPPRRRIVAAAARTMLSLSTPSQEIVWRGLPVRLVICQRNFISFSMSLYFFGGRMECRRPPHEIIFVFP